MILDLNCNGCQSLWKGSLSIKSPEYSSPQKPSDQPCKPQSPPLLASFSTLPPALSLDLIMTFLNYDDYDNIIGYK